MVLAVLYAAGGRIKGRLWLQKALFKLAEFFEELSEDLDFEAYSYGPFSEAVLEVEEALESSGLIQRSDEGLFLTRSGFKAAEHVWEGLDSKSRDVIRRVVEFMESLSKDELLLYVYATRPEYAVESKMRERVLSRRLDIALRMLRSGKVSLELAAKLAGVSVAEMLEIVKRHGVKPYRLHLKDLEL